jgi:hypothetical protein
MPLDSRSPRRVSARIDLGGSASQQSEAGYGCPTIETDESIRYLQKNVLTLLGMGMRWALIQCEPDVMGCSSGDGVTDIVLPAPG